MPNSDATEEQKLNEEQKVVIVRNLLKGKAEEIYTASCASCHGSEAENENATKFSFADMLSDNIKSKAIAELEANTMPPAADDDDENEEELSDEDKELLLDYLNPTR